MREIKFRGRRVEDGEWVYGCYNYNPLLNRAEIFFCDTVRMYVYEVDPETVGQFTGLCDKNGKEIYEGDIVKLWNGDNFSIQHSEHHACFLIGKDLLTKGYAKDSEVIGDIHSNPDLLEGGSNG